MDRAVCSVKGGQEFKAMHEELKEEGKGQMGDEAVFLL